jgi:gliding motility-associated-like protein
MKHRFTIVLILFCQWLWGQNCPIEAPLRIPPNDSITYPFDVFDVLNNNLAAPGQGVCGVQMSFRHNAITDFEVWLISPAGTEVQLIGPNATVSPATLGGTWNVTFVRCSAAPAPQVPFGSRWNNSNNAFDARGITGSYWPYIGCLEQFNTGPVNGTWRLKLKTLSSTLIAGRLVSLNIQFCDKRGQKCCFADAGVLNNLNNVAACEGDTDLNLQLAPRYSGVKPDSSKFGYTYAIGRDMILQRYDSVPDLRQLRPGNYQVCGLSYQRKDASLFPTPNTVLRLDTLRNRLLGDNAPFCGEMTSNCVSVNIAPRTDSTVLPLQVICEGDSVQIAGRSFKTNGRFRFTFNQPGRCDSLVIVPVRVQATLQVRVDSTICSGDSARIGNKRYTTTGTYRDTLQSRSGCDSIVSLNLRVLPPIPIRDTSIEICSGRSVLIGGQRFSATGTYTIPLVSRQGCDSLIRLQLNVITPRSIITRPDTVISCARNRVILDGTRSTPLGQVIYRWEDNMGNPIKDTSHLIVTRPDTYYLQVITNRSLCANRTRVIVTADTVRPRVNLAGLGILDCNTPRLTLNGNNSSNLGTPTYNWTTSGNGRIEGANNLVSAVISAPGTYNLQITNTNNGCSASATAQITRDVAFPVAIASVGDTLSCVQNSVVLSSTGSSQGANFRYTWRALNGQTLNNPNANQIQVDRAGAYELSVVNTTNNCSSLDTVLVQADTLRLALSIDPPGTLNCTQRSLSLNARANPSNVLAQYNWVAQNGGSITGANNNASISIGSAGTYALTLTNQRNGCSSTASVNVLDNSSAVTARIALPVQLSCKRPSTTLDGTGSSTGSNISYQWTTPNGNILGPSNQTQITATAAGTYRLLVRDNVSACTARDSVVLSNQQTLPRAQAGANQELTCSRPSVNLSAQGSATGAAIRYRWQGPCPIADTAAANISVNCPGTFVLRVLDTLSGCAGFDTVLVTQNPAIPNAQVASTNVDINCTAGEAILSARGSSGGQIRWFLQNNEVGRDTQLLVRNMGMYLLVIENTALACSDSARVLVNRNCKPTASLTATSRLLTCKNAVIRLDGSASTFNASVRYRWIGPSRACFNGDTTLSSINATCPGTYQLIVENLAANERDTASLVLNANQTQPSAAIARPDTLTCSQPRVSLDARGSSQGANFRYTWLDNKGQIVGRSVQIQVDAPGVYALEVLDTLNGCLAQTDVVVAKDTNLPQILLNSTVFPCNRDTFSLRASVLPAGRNYQYRWTGTNLNGRIDTTVLDISRGGSYIFAVTDLTSNCTVRDTVEIQEQANCLPCVSATNPNPLLTCTQNQVVLPLEFCRPCIGCTVRWSSNDGNFVSRADTLTPRVNRAGTYTLTVIDSNARSITLDLIVRSDQQIPLIPPGFDSSLTCAVKAIPLPNPDSTANNPITWTWQTADGRLAPDTIPGRFKAIQVGTYRLLARNVQTNCESFTLVRIGLDTLAPRANAGVDGVLDCNNQRLTLNAAGSSQGPGISYTWTALNNGNILAGENSVNPIVNAAGRYVVRVEDSRNNCFATDTLLIRPDAALPPIAAIADQTLNCRDTSLTLNGSMPTGGNYSASWCTLAANKDTLDCFNQASLRVNRTGLYSYELVDNRNNCRNRIFVNVKEDKNAPAIDAGPRDTLRCNVMSLQLNARILSQNTALRLSWQGQNNAAIQADTTLRPTVSNGGWYRVQAQDRHNFCTSTDSVFVAMDLGRPQVFAGRDTFLNCVPRAITLPGSFSSSTGEPLEARWTASSGRILSGQNSANAQVDQPGLYQLSVRNTVNNCIAMDEVRVEDQAQKPSARISGPTLLTCTQPQISLSGASSNNPFNRSLRYFWTPVGTGRILGSPVTDSIRTERAGLYRLIVTDGLSGCQDSTDFRVQSVIEAPRIDITPPATLSCSRSQVRLDASASATGVIYRYTWRGPNGQTLPDTSKTPLVTLRGRYRLSILNTQSGCTASDSVELREDFALPSVRLRALDVLDCATSSIDLEAIPQQGSNLSYRWTSSNPANILSNPNAAIIRVNAPGLYRLELSDGQNGCRSRDSLLVQEAARAIDTVLFVVQQPGCGSNQAGQVQVNNIQGGTPPYRLFLNNNIPEGNNLFRNLRPGTYTLKVEDAGGCQWAAPIELLPAQLPSVELGPDREIRLGDSVRVAPIISQDSIVAITWAAGSPLSNPSARVQILKPNSSTTAQITIRASNGCTATDFINIRVVRELPLFVPNVFSPNGDGNNDLLTIFAGPQINRVKFFRIYDRWGTQVYGLQEFRPNDPLLGWDGTLGGTLLNSAVFTWYAEVEMVDGKVELLKGDVSLLR